VSFLNFFRTYFLTPVFFAAMGGITVLFVLSYFFTWLYVPALFCIFLLALWLLTESRLLYAKNSIELQRHCAEKWSNGDDNTVSIDIRNGYSFGIKAEVYDELPEELQIRDFRKTLYIGPGDTVQISYSVKPVKRGEYLYGKCNVLVSLPSGIVQRRYRLGEEVKIAVYPSFLSMQRYEFLAISNRLQEAGIRKIRKTGHQHEFDQIKEYVSGDDYRTLNWKATARKNRLMVNQFQDERSQQVFCLINKGRVMKSPFEGMTLLDHAINTSLILCNTALKRHDKAGVITFDESQVQVLPAQKKKDQLHNIQNLLYNQQTRFLEADYGKLYATLRRQVPQRSLLILFTNFDAVSSMERQLPYLKAINRQHLLLVVFFRNAETDRLPDMPGNTVSNVYLKAIAEKFRMEKEEIVSSLRQHGITSLLSSPAGLTVHTLNKYIEMKAKGW
jgi:uncharacterized protein (DUF58 family)